MKVCNSCRERFTGSSWICPCCHQSPAVIDGYLAFSPSLAGESEGYEASFFSQLAPLEVQNFWFRSRNRLIIWALEKYFPQIHTFLEIGCGTGFVLSGLTSARSDLLLYGSEIFIQGLDFASARLSKHVTLFQMDAREIPFENEFDVIGAFDVLEHIEADRTVLAEMYRATIPGGGIILTVPQHPWLWSQADDFAHHARRYSASDLKSKVEQAGFQVVRMTSFVSLLLPLMLFSRFQQRKPNPNYDVLSELRISGWLNQWLEHTLTLERALIRLGLSFPMGGSLLLVGKKIT